MIHNNNNKMSWRSMVRLSHWLFECVCRACVCLSVCLSVSFCTLITTLRPAKTDEPIEMLSVGGDKLAWVQWIMHYILYTITKCAVYTVHALANSAFRLCALNHFFLPGQWVTNMLQICDRNILLMDNKRRILFVIKQSKGCKFMPKCNKIRLAAGDPLVDVLPRPPSRNRGLLLRQ